MGKAKGPETKPNRTEAKKKVGAEAVLELIERLSQIMLRYREREGLSQKEMAGHLGIGITTYNSLEKMRNQDGDYGCSLALLVRFCDLEGLRLTELFAELEGQPAASSERDKYEETVLAFMASLSNEQRRDFSAVFGSTEESEMIPHRARWWVDLGLDLFAMEEKERLEFEMNVQKSLLQRLPSAHPKAQIYRQRIFSLMNTILNGS